jgi:hypothetical protein
MPISFQRHGITTPASAITFQRHVITTPVMGRCKIAAANSHPRNALRRTSTAKSHPRDGFPGIVKPRQYRLFFQLFHITFSILAMCLFIPAKPYFYSKKICDE